MDSEENTVYIGKKELRNYLFSVQTQAQNFEEINILARGFSINKAVDVALISTERFLKGWFIKEISIYSEDMEHKEDNRKDRVSTIRIIIQKNA